MCVYRNKQQQQTKTKQMKRNGFNVTNIPLLLLVFFINIFIYLFIYFGGRGRGGPSNQFFESLSIQPERKSKQISKKKPKKNVYIYIKNTAIKKLVTKKQACFQFPLFAS